MLIDWERFKETYQYYDKEVVVQIIDIFDSEFEDRFAKMKASYSTRQLDDLRFQAHSLKGVVANFMAPEVYDLARQLEEQAKLGNVDGLDSLYVRLFEKASQLRNELLEYRNL
jgi:HPt (histidine-containing phosphotransfer) domain-containing protein